MFEVSTSGSPILIADLGCLSRWQGSEGGGGGGFDVVWHGAKQEQIEARGLSPGSVTEQPSDAFRAFKNVCDVIHDVWPQAQPRDMSRSFPLVYQPRTQYEYSAWIAEAEAQFLSKSQTRKLVAYQIKWVSGEDPIVMLQLCTRTDYSRLNEFLLTAHGPEISCEIVEGEFGRGIVTMNEGLGVPLVRHGDNGLSAVIVPFATKANAAKMARMFGQSSLARVRGRLSAMLGKLSPSSPLERHLIGSLEVQSGVVGLCETLHSAAGVGDKDAVTAQLWMQPEGMLAVEPELVVVRLERGTYEVHLEIAEEYQAWACTLRRA